MQFDTPPLFKRRGLMLDISRNRVPTLDCLKQLINALEELHYNELQLYTEHTFAYTGHETVWKEASPMTAEEIREIDTYCAERGIELVANQNSFGHMERWLRHEDYRHLAECPDGFIHPISGEQKFPSTLFPCPESLDFIDGLYTELLPNFQSQHLHVGGDEPWELGRGRSEQRVAAVGKHRVYLEHMRAVFALAEKHDRQAQFWADIILERPDLVPELPKSVTPVIWGYDADSPYAEHCQTVAGAGFKDNYYVAPGAGNWNSFSGRLDVARANIELAASEGRANQAKGLLLTAWGDNGHHQPWTTLFPSLILAAYACHGRCIDEAELAAQIDTLFYPEDTAGNGAALCELGKIDGLLPQPLPPMSFLHAALFANEAKLASLVASTTSEALASALEQLQGITTTALDPETELGIDLNRYALERCLNQAHRHSLESLKLRFAQQWCQNSRKGGLAESLMAFDR